MESAQRSLAKSNRFNSREAGRRRGEARLLPALSLAAAVALSCGVEPSNGLSPADSSRIQTAIPAALHAAYLQARQSAAGAVHAFAARQTVPATLTASNPEQDLAAALDASGLHLRRAHRADAVSLTLQSYGCAAAPRAAAPTPPRLGEGKNRVEYLRDGAREWYLNGPVGLEHGFTLDKDLGCGSGDGLAFAFRLDGDAAAALVGEGSEARLELRDAHAGRMDPPLLVYSDLFAVDADGRELPSRMRLSGREVRLEVDAAGARYPVTVDPMWTQQGILVAADGAEGDSFGTAVAIDGDTAVIGAAQKTVGMNSHQGQAYVFVRSGTAWSQQAVLSDSATGAADDMFGTAVAVSGDTVLVGAYNKQVGAYPQQGQAYVFVRSGTSWRQQAVLLDSATGAAFDQFGRSVALGGDTAVIGALGKNVGAAARQGQAYVFVRSGTSWSQQAVLVDSVDGKDNDQFGASVAVSGDTVVIGANEKSIGAALGQGQAYVYVRSGTSWTQQAVLTDSVTGAFLDEFGHAVAISGDTIVIGASRKTVGTHTLQGQAYVFARTGTTWRLESVLLDKALGESQDFFGTSVAVDGDIAVIGAPLKAVGGSMWQGQSYVYVRSGTAWSQDAVLVDSAAGAAQDFFGGSVALSGKTVIIGAFLKMVGTNPNQGQAYVFGAAKSPNGTPCTMGSQCASAFCVDGFCCDTACGGGATADCRSCSGAQTGGADGTCGTVVPAANHMCRAAAGICDQPEFCDGRSADCPSDGLYQLADHFLCRAATSCSRDTYCDGSSVRCPASLCLPPKF